MMVVVADISSLCPYPDASALEKVTPLSAGNISNLPKDEAIAHLRKTIGGREAILREVYEYWAAKRVRMGRPMLRRLIAPTSASDANPLTVFRWVLQSVKRRRPDVTGPAVCMVLM